MLVTPSRSPQRGELLTGSAHLRGQLESEIWGDCSMRGPVAQARGPNFVHP